MPLSKQFKKLKVTSLFFFARFSPIEWQLESQIKLITSFYISQVHLDAKKIFRESMYNRYKIELIVERKNKLYIEKKTIQVFHNI